MESEYVQATKRIVKAAVILGLFTSGFKMFDLPKTGFSVGLYGALVVSTFGAFHLWPNLDNKIEVFIWGGISYMIPYYLDA